MTLPRGRPDFRAREFFQRRHLGLVDRLGEVVAAHAPHVGLALVVLEALDVILAGFVKIDGLLVQRGEGRRERHLADDVRLGRDVDHHEVVARDRPQPDRVGRVRLRRPVPGSRRMMQKSSVAEEAA